MPGYHEETIGEKLGYASTSVDGMSEIHQQKMVKLLECKANREEVIKISKEKTNKLDSENQMKILETFHKMLKNVTVLLTELSKQGLKNKAESEVTLEKRHRYLAE